MTMRDASEVIAATLTQCKRKIEAYQAAYGLVYVGGQEASSLLRDIDVALATLPASTPPGDPCVRHACKRVRMEMQARIDALSQRAEVDGAMVDELLAIAEEAEADRAALRELADEFNGCGDHSRHKQAAEAWHYCAKKVAALSGAVTQGEGS